MVQPAGKRRLESRGKFAMQNRSSRARASPTRTSQVVVRQIVALQRRRRRLGPVQIGGPLGLLASTVHAVPVRCRIKRLARIDRFTGEPIRHYDTSLSDLLRPLSLVAIIDMSRDNEVHGGDSPARRGHSSR